MTIFRRKNMASLFSALRHNISIKRSPSKSPAVSRSSPAAPCCIPRQKKVLDFNAYFADQLEDDDDDDELMRADDLAGRGEEEEGEEDQERGESSCDESDEEDDDNHSVIIDTDDSGTIVMTVVHRCHCGRQQCQDGGSGESEAAGRNRKMGCQEQVCAERRDRSDVNCVDFCNQQLDSLRLARS